MIPLAHRNLKRGIKIKFHEKLLELRKQKGLSQEELGEKLNASRQTISKWENGQSYPDFERLVLLSDFYELSLDELVKGIDVNDVRDRGITAQQLTYIESNVRQFKDLIKSIWYSIAVVGWVIIGIVVIALILQLFTQ